MCIDFDIRRRVFSSIYPLLINVIRTKFHYFLDLFDRWNSGTYGNNSYLRFHLYFSSAGSKSHTMPNEALVRRTRARRIFQSDDGTRRVEPNYVNATIYNSSVHQVRRVPVARRPNNRRENENANVPPQPAQVRANPPVTARSKSLRAKINERANQAMQNGRVHQAIDLSTSVPIAMGIKTRKQLRTYCNNHFIIVSFSIILMDSKLHSLSRQSLLRTRPSENGKREKWSTQKA